MELVSNMGFCTFNNITGNIIHNFLNGILFNNKSENNIVSNNRVISTELTGAGIYATADSRNMQIIGNTVIGAEDGIAIQQFDIDIPSNYYINGNTLTGNKNGFWLRISNSTISNNIVSQNIVSGFDITGRFNNILNNIITYNGNSGITIAGFNSADYNNVINNVITYNVAGVSSASNYTTFNSNIISFNTFHGLISVADHVNIVNNTIKNNVGSGIFVIGRFISITQNILQNNIIGLTIQKSTSADYNTISYNDISYNGNGINSASPKSNFNNNQINFNSQTGLTITGSACNITKNSIRNNLQAGITITSTGNNVMSNIFENNLYGASFSTYKAANFNLNSLIGNTYQVYNPDTSGSLNALNNWWGSNNAPTRIYGLFNLNPRIILRITPYPSQITVGSTSTIVVDLRHNNNGVDTTSLYPGKYIIDGIIVGFVNDSLGKVNPIVYATTNGLATTTFTGKFPGISVIKSTVIAQTVSTQVKIVSKIFVTSTSPVKNAVNVAINKIITVKFSNTIKFGKNPWIELRNKWGSKPITMTISGSSLYLKPKTLLARNTLHTVILHTNSITDLTGAGISLYTFSFKTAPKLSVTSTSPVKNAVNVAVNKVITVKFNSAIKFGKNPWIEVINKWGSKPITMTISGSSLYLKPKTLLARNTLHTVILHTNSITDLTGAGISLYTFSFKTA